MTTTTEQAPLPAANYVQDVLDELSDRLPDCDTPLLEFYALLALTTGTATTLEHVHQAWAVWRNRTRPDHPSLIPFAELTPEVRELDRKYAEAIHAVAAEREAGPGVSAITPAGTTPGRAAYEAWQARRTGIPDGDWRWDLLITSENAREAWDAAGKAGMSADALRLEHERDEARAAAADLLDWIETLTRYDLSSAGAAKLAGLRQRAGVVDPAAITPAGTGHLSEEDDQ